MDLRNKKIKSLSLLKGIKENPKTTLLNSIIILFLVLIGLSHLRTALLAQMAFIKTQHPSTFTFAQTDPDLLANLARQEHLGNANLNKAQFLYKRALENFVLHVPSWLGLTELYYDKGEEKKAIATLGFVDKIFLNNEDIAWTKAIIADSLDQEDILISNLLWLTEKHPNKKREVFALADLNWNDPRILLNKFGKTYYLDILDYYIKTNELEKTNTVWQKIEKEGLNDNTNSLTYINYLLHNNEFDHAVNAWSSSFKKDDALIYNGNFEEPITGSGFGWRITKGKGISSKQAGYSGGIKISLDGSENISFQLVQTIPLPPGEYEFSSSVETDELTTDQRPFWMITGYQCQGLKVEDEMVPRTHHPETYIIPFTVPHTCKAIQIALHRNKSFFIDNKISGKVTVGKLALTSLSQTIDTPAEDVEPSPATSTASAKQIVKPVADSIVPPASKEQISTPAASSTPSVVQSDTQPTAEPEKEPMRRKRANITINKIIIRP